VCVRAVHKPRCRRDGLGEIVQQADHKRASVEHQVGQVAGSAGRRGAGGDAG